MTGLLVIMAVTYDWIDGYLGLAVRICCLRCDVKPGVGVMVFVVLVLDNRVKFMTMTMERCLHLQAEIDKQAVCVCVCVCGIKSSDQIESVAKVSFALPYATRSIRSE